MGRAAALYFRLMMDAAQNQRFGEIFLEKGPISPNFSYGAFSALKIPFSAELIGTQSYSGPKSFNHPLLRLYYSNLDCAKGVKNSDSKLIIFFFYIVLIFLRNNLP